MLLEKESLRCSKSVALYFMITLSCVTVPTADTALLAGSLGLRLLEVFVAACGLLPAELSSTAGEGCLS